MQQAPHAPRLVIVGASAGWMLSHAWLTRFEEVHTWDIDPWSAPLFGRLHGNRLKSAGITWTHHEQDPWVTEDAWRLSGPDTVYWFDNVLGQLPLVLLLPEVKLRVERLQTLLKKSHWGSVHDRYSGPISSNASFPPAWTSESGVDVSDTRAQTWLKSWGAQGEWFDHLTTNVFRPQTRVLNAAWAFKPDWGHWLEMGWQSPLH